MPLDDRAGDAEPEPAPSGCPLAPRLAAVEPVEHPLALLGRDAGAVVVDVYDEPAALGVRGEGHPARRPGVPVRVAEQVADDLGEQVGVGADRSLGKLTGLGGLVRVDA